MTVLVPYPSLLATVTEVFADRGMARPRAELAAAALCHGDLTGVTSHGLANLTRLYLPLFESGRADPAADVRVVTDLGACALVDARRTLGLWTAAAAMDDAADRAARCGVGLVSTRGATHVGCAGFHTARAARRGMIGLLASNCGGQRIARPPGGLLAMLGTNPLSVAAPAGNRHPFVLDMSTTVVPTGRIRAAARDGREIPPGWLTGEDGDPVTDPTAFDRGDAHLRWLGGDPETGSYKGFGLGLAVELLAALLPGAGRGPAAEALTGTGGPSGEDDDIGVLALAIDPAALRSAESFTRDTEDLFGTLLACPPADPARPVRYPGWPEGELAEHRRSHGVPLADTLYDELRAVAPALPVAG